MATALALAIGAVPAQAADPQVLTVLADDHYPPYVFRDTEGRLQGYTVDQWQLWQQKTGVKVQFEASNHARGSARMAEGESIVVDTLFKTAAREQSMDFGPPYAEVPVRIYVHKDIGGITGLASLRGFVVAVAASDACVDTLLNAKVSNLRRMDNYSAMIEASKRGEIKLFCMDGPAADYLLTQAGADQDFRAAFDLPGGAIQRAVRKGDLATMALVNRGFALISDAENLALNEKWFGKPLWRKPLWETGLVRLLGVVLGGTAFAVFWALAMRRTVARRTRELAEERQRLKTLVRALPDLVLLKDSNGRYEACNPVFERLVGLPESEIIGRTDADFVDSKAHAHFKTQDQRAMASAVPVVHEDWLTFAADGHRARFETLKTAIRDPDGRVSGVVGIGRDVTRARADGARLKRLNQLYRMTSGVQAAAARHRDLRALYREICKIAVEEGGLQAAWIALPDLDRRCFFRVVHAGLSADYLAQAADMSMDPGPAGDGPAGRAWRSGQSQVSRDVANDASMAPWQANLTRWGFRAVGAFVLKQNGQPRALLGLISNDENFFIEEEVQVLERLVGQVNLALDAAEIEIVRQQGADAVRQSEARFSLMFRTSPMAMALSRASDGALIDVNSAWLALFGHTRESVIGRDGLSLNLWCDESERESVFAALAGAAGVIERDVLLRNSCGDPLDISLSANGIDTPEGRSLLCSFHNVTPERQAARLLAREAEALEAEVGRRTEELRLIFEALPDLYFRLNPQGVILDHRSASTEKLIAEPAEFMGKKLADVLPGEAGIRLQAATEEAAASGSMQTVSYALSGPRGGGEFEARLMPLPRGEGVVSVVRDVSDQRALERAREAARHSAEALARQRSEFLANVSHEIRTPLNGILGFAQIGLASAEGLATSLHFQHILSSGKLLMGVINDVLDYSKIDANRLRLESLPVHLPALLDTTADLVRESARLKGLQLAVVCAPELSAWGLADPLRLQQILANLLSNAVKFTAAGRIDVHAGLDGDDLQIQVRDTGIGISPEQESLLFAPFLQADASTTRRYGGTGLGLAISQRLAQLMGGGLSVQSQLGQGSLFSLRVPWVPAAPPTEAVSTPDSAGASDRAAAADAASPPRAPQGLGDETPPPLQGLQILVAEDNAVNQLVIEQVLRSAGAEVVIADNGRIAVEAVAAEPGRYDAVLMDVQMPEMDGFEAAQRIRVLAPALPIIGQTAYALPAERERCLTVGMVAHIAKPIEHEALLTLLLGLMGRTVA